MKIEINNIRMKSLMWWRSLSPEMKKTMVHNPLINEWSVHDVHPLKKSSLQVQRMFENWLKWKIKSKEDK